MWNRTEPLSAAEVKTLRETGSKGLMWNLGTLERNGAQWRGAENFSMPEPPEGFRFTPVVRLHHAAATLESPEADQALIDLLAAWCEHHRADELQVDYDCPDRLLPRYAAVLARLREAIKPARLNATALAHWPRVAGFSELCRSVDELAPMFYDLNTDASQGKPGPLAEAKMLRRQLAAWKGCPVPWRAGLPNFTRISMLSPEGKLRGQLEEWRWEELVFHPALAVESPTRSGTTVLRAEREVTLGRHPVKKDSRLIVRWPDLEALREGTRAAGGQGAGGVIFFKLPKPGSPSGWSLETLHAALAGEAAPAFRMEREKNKLTLRNVSPTDLPPRFASGQAGADNAGWALELELEPAAVLDLAPGAFAVRDAAREKSAGHVMLRFAALRSGGSLSTGYFQMVAESKTLRWRIPEFSEAWQEAEGPVR